MGLTRRSPFGLVTYFARIASAYFVDGAVAGTSSGSSEHDDKESFRLGIFLHSVSMAMGMPVKDLLNQPLVDITSASPPSSSSSTTPAEAPSFCRTIRSRKFRFRRQRHGLNPLYGATRIATSQLKAYA